MSERVLKIIPTDQDYVPSAEQQAKAIAVLREMVPYGAIEAKVYEDLDFIDQGQDCEAVLCSSCGNRVAVDPFSGTDFAQDWYGNLAEAIAARTTSVRKFKTTMPCCGASVSLTSLKFDMPAGIARFELCATDPEIETDIKGGASTSIRNWGSSVFRRLRATFHGRKHNALAKRRMQATTLSAEQLNHLEAVLGCKLTQIEARY
jgi:hypothetical protein